MATVPGQVATEKGTQGCILALVCDIRVGSHFVKMYFFFPGKKKLFSVQALLKHILGTEFLKKDI